MSLLLVKPAVQRPIPYSLFRNQVEAGNVTSVRLSGDQITGAFAKPLPTSSPGTTTFSTTFPTVTGDADLMQALRAHHVEVDVSPPSTPWLLGLFSWLPYLLLGGSLIWLIVTARNPGNIASAFGKIKERTYSSNHPTVTFKDVAGADAAKMELQEEVDFLREPDKYRKLGARIPRGVLLVGAPGTGKTLLARAVAGEAGVQFFSLNASEFVEMFVGVGASRVRDLFAKAKAAAPAIVFIDELDAVGRRRGAGLGTVNDEREQTLNQLLGELDGFDERLDVIILAATNRPDVLDPALLRPGRFDRQVVIALPDRAGREAILRIHAGKIRLSSRVDLVALAARTIGLSGADLANLCNEAALTAARNDHAEVEGPDFESALDRIRIGAAQPALTDAEERKIVAFHEAGHALVAWLTPDADPVQKITIVPHGVALGLTEQIPGHEQRNLGVPYLRGKLAVLLGGRVAEELVFGDYSSGAEQDLVEATQLARRMVTRWGMGDLGPIAFRANEEQPFLGYEIAQGRDYGEGIASRIDDNVLKFLDEAQTSARKTLLEFRASLERVANELLKSETIVDTDLEKILGPRPSHQLASS